jgi:hypothetical protein
MKLRTSIAAVGAAALIGSGALAVPALASAHPATHTLKFISVEKQSIELTTMSGGEQDTDVNAKGKAVGFDMLYFEGTSAPTATMYATIDVAGGFLYGTFIYHTKTGAITNGKVTGGTHAFVGASGTIKVKNLNKAGTRTAVTIVYKG